MNKKFLLIVSALICVMLLLPACDGGQVETEAPTAKPTETETELIVTLPESESQTEAGPTYVTYKVTVVDENGAPVVGATVQLCVGDLCRMPCPSDENGVAVFEEPEDDYTAKVFADGYISDEDGYTFPDGSYELTVTVTSAE